MGHDDEPTDGVYGIDYVRKVGPARRNSEGKDFDVFTEAIKFIENNSNNSPFYLNVWTHIAHSPVDPHSDLVEEFDDVLGDDIIDRRKFSKNMQPIIDLALDFGGNLNTNMRNYLADVWSLDKQTGRLLQKLDDLGLRENTIVVFTADQGAAPPISGQSNPQNMLGYAGGFRGGKHDFYEGGVRTSFIIRWPGHVPAGMVNEKSVISGLDWLPTLCSIAGVSIDESKIEGEDVSDIWKGSNRQRKNPLFFKTSNVKGPKAILYKNWKFHDHKDTGKVLYDLESNPEEDINVRNIYPQIAGAMESQLSLWDSTLPTEYCLKKLGCNQMLPFDPKAQLKVIGAPLLPTVSPSPTMTPSLNPIMTPTMLPTTKEPITAPTAFPTIKPIGHPTSAPTEAPATNDPTEAPTKDPTDAPTKDPTEGPTKDPIDTPTQIPTVTPTSLPTWTPSDLPTSTPTQYPTFLPTASPTELPTYKPSSESSPSLFSATATAGNPPSSATLGKRLSCCSLLFCAGVLLYTQLV
mmetsp:Transcript_2157/g.5722  ORF Transcript_2157/g.5722 Transcript_2157/m.5722 type:complete len:519 (+) Transcript_2157:705-2261(+)|eukprot:CAMPEP_0113530372 /NCGR_PEP_ID=MMETSP0015_2-20120614/2902_1 /TAXON_ID=2838 /ORGANISM="Odontella" /LENGTH=518 /DNA_ID=CAMNT_0000429085 /DNA_START=597 /DNA_END=2153 /DNA_ORIENTATION=+ /assembly_acc=CAM_ASM_000160